MRMLCHQAHRTFLPVVLGLMLFPQCGRAQLQLDRIYPPIVGVGSELEATAEGKFPQWPLKIECDRDDVTITLQAETGKLKIAAAAEAPVGPAWIRFRDGETVSSLTPLVIGHGELVTEIEPNDRVSDSTSLLPGAIAVGRLAKSGDVDTYRIELAAGQTLVADVLANRMFASPMDAVLQLVNERGDVLEQADDSRGLDPQLIYRADRDIELYLRIFAFPETPNSTIGYSGSKEYVYALRTATTGFVDHFLPLIGNPGEGVEPIAIGWDLPAKSSLLVQPSTMVIPPVISSASVDGWQWQPRLAPGDAEYVFDGVGTQVETQRATVPFVFSGHIDHSGEVDRVSFDMVAGEKYRAEVFSRRLGFPLDPVVRLIDDGDQRELARNDDQSRLEFDAVLEYAAKADGGVTLEVFDLVDGSGQDRAYSVVVSRVSPSVRLTVATDRYTLQHGESVKLPVSIDRRDGFDRPLEIAAVDLPAGVTADAVQSSAKGDSSKSVTLELTTSAEGPAAEPIQQPFRILARFADVDENQQDETMPARHQLRPHLETELLWLTVKGKQAAAP